MDGDLSEIDVVEGDPCTVAAKRLVCLEVVEAGFVSIIRCTFCNDSQIIGKVRFNALGVLLKYWRDQDTVAEEELVLDAKRIRVVRVHGEQGVDCRVAGLILVIHCSVEVVE